MGFVTAYQDGVIPERVHGRVAKGQALAQIIAGTPTWREKGLLCRRYEAVVHVQESGTVRLYFDTDGTPSSPSRSPRSEIARLLNSGWRAPRVVDIRDNEGKTDYNLDLSRRRAASVQRELAGKYSVSAGRLDAFGCGAYSPIASNEVEDGRAKNRRVELVQW
jgi:hypothetical protein